MACCRRKSSPSLSPRATLLANMALEILTEILQSALKGLCRAGRQRAVGVARSYEARDVGELIQMSHFPSSLLDRLEHSRSPIQTAPARGAPATGFLRKKALQVPYHADRTRLIVQDDHRSGTQAAADLLHFCEIHFDVQVLLGQKIRGRSSGQYTAKLYSVTHAARVLLEDLTRRRPKRQLPQTRALHFAARSVQLRPAVRRPTEAFEPVRTVVDDMWDVAECFDILHD